MPLTYDDFARYYDGQLMSEEQRRAHFEVFADALECIARLFWADARGDNHLGITLDQDTITPVRAIDSSSQLATPFNEAAAGDAGKKDI